MTGNPCWERLPKETGPAWNAWVHHRDQGPTRSVRTTAKALDKSDTLVGQWSSRHNWVERAKAWDAWLDAQVQAAAVKKGGERAAELLAKARITQALAELPELEWARRRDKKYLALDKLEIPDLAQTTERLDRVRHRAFQREQLLTGGATDRTELTGPGGSPLEVRIVDLKDAKDPRSKEPEAE